MHAAALWAIYAALLSRQMTKDEINILEEEWMDKLRNMDELTLAVVYRCGYLLEMRLERAESIIRKARDGARKQS